MESFRTADGRTLAYRREGAGPLLVCHPGGPGFSSRYFGDLAGLGESFTLILLDPRGTGGSDHPAEARAYETADYVADLDELRAHLGLERMLLLGHSHGGVVAAAYAAAHPGRVEKLVLASTVARFAEEQEAAMVRMMETRSAEPWYADAREAIDREQGGDFAGEEELQELVKREMPFYFAHFGDEERRYVEWLGEERPNPGRAPAVQYRDLARLRPASRLLEHHRADARDHRRAGLHHRAGLRCRLRGHPRSADGAGRRLRPLHPPRGT